ncbi:MAG: hypothetical protein KVP17_002228 [Porospora cf. gigantea B]|uniref:uncharacterized protein n=1 Tax=Porospora cf. gigantea B TaxID=2853592 RepID=UPI0035718F90|nr:MAG: hypothetical protein KVP17_002228 [Porospora cf. gigantea B]
MSEVKKLLQSVNSKVDTLLNTRWTTELRLRSVESKIVSVAEHVLGKNLEWGKVTAVELQIADERSEKVEVRPTRQTSEGRNPKVSTSSPPREAPTESPELSVFELCYDARPPLFTPETATSPVSQKCRVWPDEGPPSTAAWRTPGMPPPSPTPRRLVVLAEPIKNRRCGFSRVKKRRQWERLGLLVKPKTPVGPVLFGSPNVSECESTKTTTVENGTVKTTSGNPEDENSVQPRQPPWSLPVINVPEVSKASKAPKTSKTSKTSKASKTSKISKTHKPSEISKTQKPSKSTKSSKTAKSTSSNTAKSTKTPKPSNTSKTSNTPKTSPKTTNTKPHPSSPTIDKSLKRRRMKGTPVIKGVTCVESNFRVNYKEITERGLVRRRKVFKPSAYGGVVSAAKEAAIRCRREADNRLMKNAWASPLPHLTPPAP